MLTRLKRPFRGRAMLTMGLLSFPSPDSPHTDVSQPRTCCRALVAATSGGESAPPPRLTLPIGNRIVFSKQHPDVLPNE
ncbi:hypothetical protein J1614_009712 [Plenodomus biglobosus]|nr:hypothetical protein J1614_009712 [Plenodomus biglobosus]